jgi:hypothetical protein
MPSLIKDTRPWAVQRLRDWEIEPGSYHVTASEYDEVVEWMTWTDPPLDRLKISPWGGFALVPKTVEEQVFFKLKWHMGEVYLTESATNIR